MIIGWHLDRAAFYDQRGPKAKRGFPPPPPNTRRTDKDDWPAYEPLVRETLVWASAAKRASGVCTSAAAAAPAPAGDLHFTSGSVGDKLCDVSWKRDQDAPMASPRVSAPPRQHMNRTASKAKCVDLEAGVDATVPRVPGEAAPPPMVPRVRIPNPPSPSKLHNLKRHPGLLRQQMISHLPEDDLPRTEEEEEQAAHPFLVGIRTAPARSTGVIVYQLQNFWERTTSAVSNFFAAAAAPQESAQQWEELSVVARRWSPTGVMQREAISKWRAWRDHRVEWRNRINYAFGLAEAAPYLKRRQAYKTAFARLTWLWELEKTMKPLEIEAMRAVLETLDEPITDPIIDQAREILTKHERQKKLNRLRALGAAQNKGGQLSPERGALSAERAAACTANGASRTASNVDEAQMQRSREASAEAARRQEEERLAKVAKAKATAARLKEEKAAKAEAAKEAARVAALERAEQAAAARAAAKAAREEKAAAERAAKADADAAWKEAAARKKEAAKTAAEAKRHAKEAEALNQASLESRTEAGHTSRTSTSSSSQAPTGAVRAMESEHLCPMAAVSCAPPFQKRLSPRPATSVPRGEEVEPQDSRPARIGQVPRSLAQSAAPVATPAPYAHPACRPNTVSEAETPAPNARPARRPSRENAISSRPSHVSVGAGQSLLPPECTQPAPWKGADRRWAKFMKAAAKHAGGSMPPNSRNGSPRGENVDFEIKRKPLFPELWEKLPRAVATQALVIRRGPELDSEAMGNLLPGSEVFIKERRPPGPDGSIRALVTDTPQAGKEPLGWVTSLKEGADLLTMITHGAATPTVDGATGFFTSVGRSTSAPLRSPTCSPRADDEGSIENQSALEMRETLDEIAQRSKLFHRPWGMHGS